MARVRVTRERSLLLPPVCAKCGAATRDRVLRRFAWRPWWVVFFIVLSPPVLLVAYLAFRRTALVGVPLCDRHANEWRVPRAFAWAGLSASGGLILAAAVLDAVGAALPFAAIIGGTGITGVLGFLIAVGVWRTFLIHADRITRHDLILAGVAPAFAEAVAADRERHRPRDYGDYADDDRPRRNRYEVDEGVS